MGWKTTDGCDDVRVRHEGPFVLELLQCIEQGRWCVFTLAQVCKPLLPSGGKDRETKGPDELHREKLSQKKVLKVMKENIRWLPECFRSWTG